jgi:hypothetical protein
MITAFLLLPVLAILLWLYAYLLPQRGKLKFFDFVLFVAVIIAASIFVHFVQQINWVDSGPMWPDLVSAVGAYAILLGGLAAGLFWRRYRD